MAGLRTPIAILVALLAAAGCAAPGPYPSLAPRPAETAYSEDERQPTAQPDDPALAGEIDRIAAAAATGASEFDAAWPAAEAAVSTGGGAGSDSWVEGQQAVSRLEAVRARTTAALADLDALATERAKAGTLGPADGERLRTAVAQLQALADGQAERIKRLEERLAR
jgi:hypothetical protein